MECRGWRAAACATCCAGLTVGMVHAVAKPEARFLGSGRDTLVLRLASRWEGAAPSRGHARNWREERGDSTLSPRLGSVLPRRKREQAHSPVLVAAATASTARDVPSGESRDDVDAPAEASQPAGGEARAGDAGWQGLFGWGIPPIRWGGYLITDLRSTQVSDRPRRLQQVEMANIKGSSYIYQPWFAQVSGGLGLVVSKEKSSGNTGLTAEPAQETMSKAVTGNAELTLFPTSRFPFNAFYDVSDSRASGELTASDVTNTRVGLRQSYRPLEGIENYSASVNRSTLESTSFGRDTVNALAVSMNRSVEAQTFDLAGSYTTNTRSNTGENTSIGNLFARHSYRPEPEFSVDSLVNLNSTAFHLLSSGLPVDNRSRFAQASTFATWRPEEDSPLFVTGGARYFQSSIASSLENAQTNSLSANIASTYALSEQTRATAQAIASRLTTNAGTRMLRTQSAGINHAGVPKLLAGYTYNWNASANLARQSGLPEGTRQSFGGQLGHYLSRDIALGTNSRLSINLSQNAGAIFERALANSSTLGHSASVAWRMNTDAATSAYIGLLGSDSVTRGLNENHFQMINLQASGQLQFSRSSMATVSLTTQAVRQRTQMAPTAPTDPIAPELPIAPINSTTSGSFNYIHTRAFDVPRLRYSALYTINDSQYRSRLQGDVDASRERISQSFEQRLDYRIGRMGLRLSLRVAKIEQRQEALIFLRVAREFGSF